MNFNYYSYRYPSKRMVVFVTKYGGNFPTVGCPCWIGYIEKGNAIDAAIATAACLTVVRANF